MATRDAPFRGRFLSLLRKTVVVLAVGGATGAGQLVMPIQTLLTGSWDSPTRPPGQVHQSRVEQNEHSLGQVAGMCSIRYIARGRQILTRLIVDYVEPHWVRLVIPPRNRCLGGGQERREVKTWDETEMQLRRPRVDLFRGSHENKGQALLASCAFNLRDAACACTDPDGRHSSRRVSTSPLRPYGQCGSTASRAARWFQHHSRRCGKICSALLLRSSANGSARTLRRT